MDGGIRRIQRGRNHGYTINGQKAIGVTTALSKGLPKPALMYWAAKCVANEAADALLQDDAANMRWYRDLGINNRDQLVDYLKKAPIRLRDDAALRGTKIHGYAQQLVEDQDDIDVPEELAGHVESAVKFLHEWQVRPLLVERTVGSYQWGYAGTFDLIGELPDGRRILFDYKTGASGIWPDTALQLAAYRYADAYVADGVEVPMKEVGVTDCMGVWLRADGYDVIPLTGDGTVFKAFLHVLQVAKAVAVMDQWKHDAILPPSKTGNAP